MKALVVYDSAFGNTAQVVQAIAATVYGGERRPWWFWALSTLLIAFYLAALFIFLTGGKSIAGWLLMVLIPVGWVIKGGLVIFNAKGRKVVSSMTGNSALATRWWDYRK